MIRVEGFLGQLAITLEQHLHLLLGLGQRRVMIRNLSQQEEASGAPRKRKRNPRKRRPAAGAPAGE